MSDDPHAATRTAAGPRSPISIRVRVVLAAGVLIALGVLAGVVPVPSVGGLLADVADTLGAWTYLLVPVLAFLETAAFVGLVVPGETAVLVGGVVAARGEVVLALIIALVWAAAVAGDLTAFLLGRRLGGPFLRRHAGRLRIDVAQLDRVERVFARHGGKAVLTGRFVGVLRAFTPFVAGTSGMALGRFAAFSAAGALAWSVLVTLLGYAFASSFETAGSVITQVTVAAAVLAGLAVWFARGRRRRRRRDRAARTAPRPRALPAGAA